MPHRLFQRIAERGRSLISPRHHREKLFGDRVEQIELRIVSQPACLVQILEITLHHIEAMHLSFNIGYHHLCNDNLFVRPVREDRALFRQGAVDDKDGPHIRSEDNRFHLVAIDDPVCHFRQSAWLSAIIQSRGAF